MNPPATSAESAPQAPVRSRIGMSVDTVAQPTSVEPGERGHAPRRAVTTEGIEARRVGMRAEVAAAQRGNTRGSQAASRESREVGQPSARPASMELRRRVVVLRQERAPDVVADFQRPQADGRAEPRDDIARIALECRKRRLEYARCKP